MRAVDTIALAQVLYGVWRRESIRMMAGRHGLEPAEWEKLSGAERGRWNRVAEVAMDEVGDYGGDRRDRVRE